MRRWVISANQKSNVTVRRASGTWRETKSKILASLCTGKQTVDFAVPTLTVPEPVTVRIESSTAQRDSGPFTLRAPRQWTLHLA